MTILIPTTNRVGLVQYGYAIAVHSVCCDALLRVVDETTRTVNNFYYCDKCGLKARRRCDSKGNDIGTQISVGVAQNRLNDWISTWLGQPATVKVVAE